jgi:hypothetical protein
MPSELTITARQAALLLPAATEATRVAADHIGSFALGSPQRRWQQDRAVALRQLRDQLAEAAEPIERQAPSACPDCGVGYADHLEGGGSRWRSCQPTAPSYPPIHG